MIKDCFKILFILIVFNGICFFIDKFMDIGFPKSVFEAMVILSLFLLGLIAGILCTKISLKMK